MVVARIQVLPSLLVPVTVQDRMLTGLRYLSSLHCLFLWRRRERERMGDELPGIGWKSMSLLSLLLISI